MNDLYSKEATIDRVSTAYLLKRYNLNSRTALLNRLSALEIKPVREGNRFFVSADEMDKLDTLNHCLKRGNSLAECVIEVKTGSFSKFDEDPMNNSTSFSVVSAQPNIAQPITAASPLVIQLLPAPDPMQTLRSLQEAADKGWVLPTSQLLPLLGLKSCPSYVIFSRRGFVFERMQRNGREIEWRIKKQLL